MKKISTKERFGVTFPDKEGERKYILFVAFLFLLHLLPAKSRGQIRIDAARTAAELSQKLTGQGVTVLNSTLTCAAVANGIFVTGNSNLGLDSGIVLTTGRAATGGAYGVNGYSAWLASTDNGMPGDAMLNTLGGMNTVDACALEFDVIPLGDTIKFDYVFSSEEYINAVCGTYNDAFAFFISGPGISGSDNMALVPGTSIPVTINSINNGVPGSLGNIVNCTNMGAGSPFTGYYKDNSFGTTLTHKGLTQVMQAIHQVTPCQTYHLKLVIADAGDATYDSGVFLKAGSLHTGSFSMTAVTEVPDLVPAPICIKQCLPGRIVVKRSQATAQPQVFVIQTEGSAVSGYDYLPLPDSIVIPAHDTAATITVQGLPTPLNGTRVLKVLLSAPVVCTNTSSVIDSAEIAIYDTTFLNIAFSDTSVCYGDRLFLSASGHSLISYSWSPSTGLSDPTAPNPVALPNHSTTYVVSGSIPGTNCPVVSASVRVVVKAAPQLKSTTDTIVCYNHALTVQPYLLSENPNYSYLWTGPDSFTSAQKSPTIDSVTPATSGIYTLVVTLDTDGCTARELAYISAYVPPLPVIESDTVLCTGDQPLELVLTGTSIKWYASATDTLLTGTPVIPTGQEGAYLFFATQTIRQCESPREPVYISVRNCCDGKMFVPTAFSPNGDGRNDDFAPWLDYGYFLKQLVICDRWGKTVFQGNSGKWDGRCDGRNCETGVYFYLLKVGCIRGGTVEKTGDITLIR